MKIRFLSRFSFRVKLAGAKSLLITVLDHETNETFVHVIDVFTGKVKDKESQTEDSNIPENKIADDNAESADQAELIEEQLEEGN